MYYGRREEGAVMRNVMSPDGKRAARFRLVAPSSRRSNRFENFIPTAGSILAAAVPRVAERIYNETIVDALARHAGAGHAHRPLSFPKPPAMEVPELLLEDIRTFARTVEAVKRTARASRLVASSVPNRYAVAYRRTPSRPVALCRRRQGLWFSLSLRVFRFTRQPRDQHGFLRTKRVSGKNPDNASAPSRKSE